MSRTLTLTRPDDWHLHLRDGAPLAAVLPYTARQFARAIVMPNLKPPVTTVADAAAYRQRILVALPIALPRDEVVDLLDADGRVLAEDVVADRDYPPFDKSLVDGLPLKILANFQPEHDWVLEPGDLLYLPPAWGHDGVAEGECMTASVGFRVPSDDGLARELLQRLAQSDEVDGRL